MKIGIIGLGNVGAAFIKLLHNKNNLTNNNVKQPITIVALKDIYWGNCFNKNGINTESILKKMASNEKIDDGTLSNETNLHEIDEIDVIVECTSSNYVTGEPGYSFIKNALKAKKHVITPNKGPIALACNELLAIAKQNNVFLKYESTVLSGTPVFNFGDNCLKHAEIESIEGIMNGTSNFILEQMAAGFSFNKALKVAQENGYAEADPTNDVEGYDARAKVAILTRHFFDENLPLNKIETTGISNITPSDIQNARKNDTVIKLIGNITKKDHKLFYSVTPKHLPAKEKLAGVSGVNNALLFTTKLLGEVLIVGPGAGRIETAYGLYTDLLEIINHC